MRKGKTKPTRIDESVPVPLNLREAMSENDKFTVFQTPASLWQTNWAGKHM